jgi:thiamine biosynthesis lipoprotein
VDRRADEGGRPAVHAVHHRESVMGTVITIDIYTADGGASPEIMRGLATAQTILQQADAVFSTWNADSPVSRLRRGEITSDQAPPEVADVIERCAAARAVSGGWFDPWAMPGGFDPTGLVKGWAAQRAANALTVNGALGAIVNAAGDIASFGALGPGAPFRIGIADPFARTQLAAVAELTGAIATSGSYERGPHLIDPYSGQAAVRVASASVTGPDLGLADALATALAVAGEPGLAFIEALDGYEALVIGHHRQRRSTASFPFAPPAAPAEDEPPRPHGPGAPRENK